MKKIYLLGLGLLGSFAFSQVGIDTNTPQRQLHVSGTATAPDANGVVEPTIRVEGLNSTNNPANDGAGLKPVYVDENGDMVLLGASGTDGATGYGYLVGSNAEGDDLTPVLGTYDNSETSVNTLGTYNFTLPSQSLVHFNKTISLNIAFNSTTPLSDGAPRMVQVTYKITAAPDSDLVGKFIATGGTSYTSHDATGASGYIFLGGAESVILPAGDYTVALQGRMSANSTVSDQDFLCLFGDGVDEVSIIAEPWLY